MLEIENLKKALEMITSSRGFYRLIPEVRTNIVMAKENARTINDVAGIPGRITVHKKEVFACREPEYGASSHLARLILEIRKHDPTRRSAINIRYDKAIIEFCEMIGLKVSYYDRRKEPREIKGKEGATIPWGVKVAIRRIGEVPDVIYHKGDWGKEPMIVLLASDAIEAARMAIKIGEEVRI
ncbi:thiamine-phosphate synthase family protein [Methanothermobacter tenebrarum]|uniref:Thiamine-phosphate synthase n=1 Tax=Methanothermobacter tenebrarum TaxID=680118 RepID=A0A328P9V6_9EURY|nr:thiamine-phosphate synthase family protein [Methanothermobacter tenebrarum]MBC7100131.1 thiamine-phosphate synthase [Methanobacteriales archaeon]NPV64920.1 thiamine-phosphate synthase [Methanobacteriaceae archaeon]RAO79387.1 thiamine-phosphate synthase [Methanothermobacter tenebrarum]